MISLFKAKRMKTPLVIGLLYLNRGDLFDFLDQAYGHPPPREEPQQTGRMPRTKTALDSFNSLSTLSIHGIALQKQAESTSFSVK
jgi:hypothetical protein